MRFSPVHWLSCVILLLPGSGWGAGFPPVETILSNVVQRASLVGARREPLFGYSQVTVVEELDSRGTVKDRKEKHYDVTLVGGLPRQRLVRVNGQSLSDQQLREEQEKDRARRQRFEERRQSGKGDDVEVFITHELVSRYVFQIQGREEYNGREAWILSFRPRSRELPVRRMQDRVLNNLSGLLWIDVQESEVARADVHLTGKISLWGGLVGSLEIFDVEINRARSDQGVWFNQNGRLRIEGRKLFSPLRYRATESSTDFRLLRPAESH